MNKKLFDFREPKLNARVLYITIQSIGVKRNEAINTSLILRDMYAKSGTNWLSNFQVYKPHLNVH